MHVLMETKTTMIDLRFMTIMLNKHMKWQTNRYILGTSAARIDCFTQVYKRASRRTQLMKVAHKQTETRQQMQPCNLSPTQSQTHLRSERAHPHTWVTHRMFGVQNDLPRVPFSRPSPWQLTDTQHSSIPPRVTTANIVRGACISVCGCVCVVGWPAILQG